MISSYVEDFILTGQDEFIKGITEKVKEKLDISKMEGVSDSQDYMLK